MNLYQETNQTSRRFESVHNLVLSLVREWTFRKANAFRHFSPPIITSSTSQSSICTRNLAADVVNTVSHCFERQVRPNLILLISKRFNPALNIWNRSSWTRPPLQNKPMNHKAIRISTEVSSSSNKRFILGSQPRTSKDHCVVNPDLL